MIADARWLGVARALSLALFLFGCGDDEAAQSAGPDAGLMADTSDGPRPNALPPGGSYLSEDARQELEATNPNAYLGKAVIVAEEDEGEAIKVSYDPESGPICLRGAPFHAFYADRGSDKTVFLLDGGGACWTGFCAASAMALEMLSERGPASRRSDNPFQDWNLVFVPYCDGSVFSGDNQVIEEDGTTRYHHGRQNLSAGLDLLVDKFGDSSQVMVGGFSAGGYGSLLAMFAVRLLFPATDLSVMNDSGPGIQNLDRQDAILQRLEEWQHGQFIPPSCAGCQEGTGQFTHLFSWFLERDSNVRISLLSYYEDGIIGMAFNGLSGPEYKQLLLQETAPIHMAYPDRFKRFMRPGDAHVLSGMWGTVTADGVEVSDWVNAMVDHDDQAWRDITEGE